MPPSKSHVGGSQRQSVLYPRPDSAPVPENDVAVGTLGRPKVSGRFLTVGDRKLLIRGATYGTFRPDEEGHHYPTPDRVHQDLAEMGKWGFNALRTYTAPPRWLLDAASEHGIRVLAGLSWTQHVTFLDDRRQRAAIRDEVRRACHTVAGHPALLGFTIGNEIPAPIVRWSGRGLVERFLESLYDVVKSVDPEALTTYVNYPTTEYLELPFLDFESFNVYLEREETLERYLARLHNLAGDRPLVMAEIGLDSRRNGEGAQASSLAWQIRTSLASGCAGAFVFQWTDEWYRGGFDIEDWDFGLTTRSREPKLALMAASAAFNESPVSEPPGGWPSISVVCCTYNGSRTLRDTLKTITDLDYPDYEVIVVNDGSTDGSGDIAALYPVKVITTENRGLSSARNTGAEAASGEIVVYIDDDAFPDAHWLHFLAVAFRTDDWAAIGGPNLLPPGSNGISECVANAPGGPIHVLLSDREAEHIPGCNFAIRRDCLRELGGFDARFKIAGDDVDLCWRIHEKGWKIGFHPGAMVFHHSRDTVRRYWRQQLGYGKAEGMLERKWPEKYNSAGHVAWSGRLYGSAQFREKVWSAPRIYYGVWGSAPFQALYRSERGAVLMLAMMPEWYLLIASLTLISVLGIFWSVLLAALPVLAFTVGLTVVHAYSAAALAARARAASSPRSRLKFIATTTWLHLIQPVARLWGRFGQGLTPWRHQGLTGWMLPRARSLAVWSENWRDLPEWIERLAFGLRKRGVRATAGGPTDAWDLSVTGGLFGGAQVLLTAEEHGEGKQYVRARIRPRLRVPSLAWAAGGFFLLGVVALTQGQWGVGAVLVGIGSAMGAVVIQKSGAAVATLVGAVQALVVDD